MKPVGVPREGAGSDRILAIADSLVDKGDAQAEEHDEVTSWISFRIADRDFALPVSHVRGVHRLGHVTPLPRSPRAVRGLINLRGRVLALIDPAVQLGLVKTPIDAASRVLDTELEGRRLGLLVESGGSLLRIRNRDLEPPSDELDVALGARIIGVLTKRSKSVVLLDPVQLLTDLASETDDDDS